MTLGQGQAKVFGPGGLGGALGVEVQNDEALGAGGQGADDGAPLFAAGAEEARRQTCAEPLQFAAAVCETFELEGVAVGGFDFKESSHLKLLHS